MKRVLAFGKTPEDFRDRVDELHSEGFRIVPGTMVAEWQRVSSSGGNFANNFSSPDGLFCCEMVVGEQT